MDYSGLKSYQYRRLDRAIEKAITDNNVGGAVGFDMKAALRVLQLKRIRICPPASCTPLSNTGNGDKCKRELWVVFYLQSNKIAFEYQSVIF